MQNSSERHHIYQLSAETAAEVRKEKRAPELEGPEEKWHPKRTVILDMVRAPSSPVLPRPVSAAASWPNLETTCSVVAGHLGASGVRRPLLLVEG